MGKFRWYIFMMAAVVLVWNSPGISGEYYVIENRSGVILITDHKPEKGATLLKGPFESRESAEEALTDTEKEKLGTPGKGRGQGKGCGQGRGQGQGKNR